MPGNPKSIARSLNRNDINRIHKRQYKANKKRFVDKVSGKRISMKSLLHIPSAAYLRKGGPNKQASIVRKDTMQKLIKENKAKKSHFQKLPPNVVQFF